MSKDEKNLEVKKAPLSDEELEKVNGGSNILPVDNPYKNNPDRDKRDKDKRPFG